MTNILIVSYSYIAALIGAGFATGQEILCYFITFGKYGLCGIAVSAAIFAVFAYFVLRICIKLRIHSFSSFLSLLGFRPAAQFIKLCTGSFSFTVYAVMLSACGTMLNMIFGIPIYAGSFICAVICAMLFCRSTEGVFDINGIIGIILTIGISVCCFYMLRYREYHVFSQSARAVGSGYIYSGYNIISVTPVLAVLSRRLKSRSDAAAVSITSGAAIFVLMLLIFSLLSIYHGKIYLGEFPMLTLAARQNKLFSYIYALLLTGAIISTMFSSGGSMIEIFALQNNRKSIWAASLCGYLLSLTGFSGLVNTAYRLFGLLGIAVGILTAVICLLKKRNKK